MALIIAPSPNADSYAARAGFIAYSLARYGEIIPDEDATDQPMRRAFDYLNGLRWKGTRTDGRSQSGAWPRSGVVCEGEAILDSEIPPEVIDAQYEFARAELAVPGVLSPQGSVLDAIRNRAKVDVIEVGFDTSRILPTVENLQVIVTAGMRKIDCFVLPNVRMTDAVSV